MKKCDGSKYWQRGNETYSHMLSIGVIISIADKKDHLLVPIKTQHTHSLCHPDFTADCLPWRGICTCTEGGHIRMFITVKKLGNNLNFH